MALPPLWKLRRELARFPVSLASKARASLGPVNRVLYDLTAARRVRVTDGDRPETPEPAVFLIYQPERLLKSLFMTLRHLVDEGLCVILVANHPLDADKIEALRPYCHKLIERPNIGYDFGGYRTGVLHVLDTMPSAERLFVLNDSNWFPVRGESDLIAASRNDPADVYGIFLYRLERRARDRHIQSFFYRFSARLMRDPVFRDYWRKMPLIQEKRLVVRWFEVGLSRTFREAGFTLGSFHTASGVVEAALRLPPAELQETLRFLLAHDYIAGDEITALSNAGPARLADTDAVRRVLEASNFPLCYLGTHPTINHRGMESPFLKKNDQAMFRDMRRIIRTGPLRDAMHPDVVAELDWWDADQR